MKNKIILMIITIILIVLVFFIGIQLGKIIEEKNIKNEYRSRIMSVFSMLALSSEPLGNMFYGFLSNMLPAYICIFIASGAVLTSYPLILYVTKDRQCSS